MVAADLLAAQRGIVELSLHQAQFGDPVRDRLGDLGGVADGHLERDPRVGRVESDQPRRQPVAGDGLAGVDRQASTGQTGKVVQRGLGRRDPGQDRASLDQESFAGLVEHDVATDPVEQGDAVAAFQRRHGAAHGRLRQVERLGCARDVLPFGQR